MANLSSNIWKYYAAGVLQSFWFVLAINIIYYQSFGITYSQLGMFEFVSAVAILLLEVPTGAVADLISRKLSVFSGTIISAAAMFLIGFSSTAAFFAIGYLVWAVGTAFISGAKTALIYDTLGQLDKKDEFLKVQGRYNFYTTISLIIGTLVAPFLFKLNIRLPYIIMGFLWVLSSFFVIAMKEPEMERKRYSLRAHLIQIKEGVHYSVNHKFVRWFFLYSILIGAPMLLYNDLMTQPYYLSVGYSISSLGILTALIYGSASLVSSVAYRIEKKLGENASLFLIASFHTIGFLLMGLLKTPLIIAVVVLLYMSRDFRWVVLDNYVNIHIQPKMRATVLSVGSMATNIVMAVLYLGAGYLTDKLSIAPVLVIFGLFTGISTIALFLAKPEGAR